MMELRGYLTNLGKYNEGELCGKWIEFPMTEEEFAEHLEDIGVDGHRYEEYFWTDWESDLDADMGLGEHENLEFLNFLAEKSREEILSEYYSEYPDDRIFPMDDFEDVLYGIELLDIVSMAYSGRFNPNSEFFRYDRRGNLETPSVRELEEDEDMYIYDMINNYKLYYR